MPGPWVNVRGAVPGPEPQADPPGHGPARQPLAPERSAGKPKAVGLSIVVIGPNASAAGTSGRHPAHRDMSRSSTVSRALCLRVAHAPWQSRSAQAHRLPGSHGPSSRNELAPNSERKVDGLPGNGKGFKQVRRCTSAASHEITLSGLGLPGAAALSKLSAHEGSPIGAERSANRTTLRT